MCRHAHSTTRFPLMLFVVAIATQSVLNFVLKIPARLLPDQTDYTHKVKFLDPPYTPP